MPCNQWIQLRCKPPLEDLRSHVICFLMFLPLKNRRQSLHDKSNWSMTLCFVEHINFDYQICQKVLKYDKRLQGKLKPKTTGPFDVRWVHSNSTVTISLQPGITECVNVCRPLPYREPTPLNSYLEFMFSSSLIEGRESVIPSCTFHRIPRNPVV